MLSNHNNNWSHCLAGAYKGTSVGLNRTGRGNSAVLCLNHCHAIALRNTEPYCVAYVCMTYVWITCKCTICCACGCLCLCGCAHLQTVLILVFIFAGQLPPPPFSITPSLYMNGEFVWFFPQLSAVHSYPGFALCFLAGKLFFPHGGNHSWLGAMAEEWQTNTVQPTSEPIRVPTLWDNCQPNPLALPPVQEVLINNWYWNITELAPSLWVNSVPFKAMQNTQRHSTCHILCLS